MQNKEDFVVPGLSRGIHILELLAKRPEGLTQSEIAQALSIPFASVSRITNQLGAMGYLLRHPQSKAFRLSMRMMMVGQRALIRLDMMELAIPVMRQIRDEMQDTVALGVIQGTNVVVVESVPGTHPFIFTLNPGFSGWALDNAEEYDGVYCIAVPILDRTGFPLAAIWVTGPSNRVPANRHPKIACRLIELVGGISSALGYGKEQLR